MNAPTSTSTGSIAARKADWQETLRKIQAAPLTFCPDFPARAQRWNAWWEFSADRPLLIAEVRNDVDIRWDKAFDLLDQPAEWIKLRREQVAQTHYAGESLPFVRVDIGPVAMAAFMGVTLELALKEGTSWQHPTIDSWDDLPPLEARADNKWLRQVLRLTEELAVDAANNYLVCLPDLTGAIDALANMRSPEKLCFDLYEHRETILRAAAQGVNAWESVFTQLYDIVLGKNAGITQWISCWADAPFTVPTCDFNALIGPADFVDVCIPSLTDQARRAGLCVSHLDGPEASRHAETLAKAPEITAVQFTPGAGTPSALAKIPMFKMFQEHQVPLFIEVQREEVEELAEALDPRGVAIRVEGLKTAAEADALVKWRDERFG